MVEGVIVTIATVAGLEIAFLVGILATVAVLEIAFHCYTGRW